MSQSTTSDLVSTIATQLNIVIVALRLLVEMIQNPESTSPADLTPGSCPSRPHASPASPLFCTSTIPSISWAPCEQPVLSMPRQKTPSPTMTSMAEKHTSPHHPSSPALAPLPSPFSPPSFPPFSPSRSLMRSFLPPLLLSPFLPPPFFLLLASLTHPPPLWLLLLPRPLPLPAPSSPLLPTAHSPLVPANAALPLPLPLLLLPPDTTQILLGMTIGVPKTMIFLSASKATKDFDPVGATSLPKWSARSPRSALVGLNFSNYNSGLHHNLHRGLVPSSCRLVEKTAAAFFSGFSLRCSVIPFFSLLLFEEFFASPQPLGPNFVSLFLLTIFKRQMSTTSTTATKRSRPSMASHLRDSDEPLLISTTFPKKARPATPPTSLRTTSTSVHPSRTSTPSVIHLHATDATHNADRPLVGLLVKLNGEEIPFLIPRPNRPFRLPEATP